MTDNELADLSDERTDVLLDQIKDHLGNTLVNAKVDFAVRRMNRIVTVVFDVGKPTRQEFRITVEDVT